MIYKIPHVRKGSNYNRETVEEGRIDTPTKHIHD